MSDDNPQGLKDYFVEAKSFGPGEEGVQGCIGCASKVPAHYHPDG